ncbi:hypothetical protein [Streptomyces sp. Ac-502]|uniref:hypothetical protein n=1 Tax=Streptomyces sp. Ac-502 TaxID=3342801 RepID=UPI0038628220
MDSSHTQHAAEAPHSGPPGPFEVVDGRLEPAEILAAVRTVIAGQTWPRGPARLEDEGPGRCTVRVEGTALTIRSAPCRTGHPARSTPFRPDPASAACW